MNRIQNNSKDFDEEEKDLFIASIIHDLKTPLCAQMKILELLLHNRFEPLKPRQNEIISEVYNSCKYTYNLALNIFDFYLYKQNKISLNKEYFDWNKFLEDIFNEFSGLIEEKSQIISTKSDLKNERVFGDKLQLKRVISNLLSNSVLYSPKNSTIEVITNKKNDFLELKMVNYSIYPISKEINKIFDTLKTSLYSVDNQNGSGIGLFVVKRIIEAHEGSVFARKTKTNSCTIGFKIPINKD